MAERQSDTPMSLLIHHCTSSVRSTLICGPFSCLLAFGCTSAFPAIHTTKCTQECTLLVRSVNKLSDAFARSSISEGRYSDGGGLYLNVKVTGTKSWIFLYVRNGRRQALGLGSYPALRLPAAREKAGELRTALATGEDLLIVAWN